MFGPETFIVRIADDAMAPRLCAGDYMLSVRRPWIVSRWTHIFAPFGETRR